MELSNGVRRVHGKISGKNWLEDKNGHRITDKHNRLIYQECKEGPYIPVYVGISGAAYLFHEKSDKILIKSENGFIITKISESLYSVYNKDENSNWQYVLYDAEGNIVLSNMDSVSSKISCGLVAVEKNGKWGYIDEKGNWVIQPLWPYAESFNESGYAVVRFKGDTSKYAIINEVGTYTCTPIECDLLKSITDTTFLIQKGEKKGVVDEKGKFILPYNLYSDIIDVDGYYKVKSYQGTYGLYDNTGKEIFECIYPQIIEMEEKFMVQDVGKKEHIKTVPKQKQN